MCGPVVVEQDVVPSGIHVTDPADFKHDDEELIRQVPLLLERMNDAAADLNRLELELSGAEVKHKNALVTWSRLYDDLRSRHGSVSGAMDHAKPYFDTLKKCQAATSIAREAKLRWKLQRQHLKAAEQEAPEVETLNLLRKDVQTCAEEFEVASKALKSARAELQAQREKVGTATIESARPCFSSLKKLQLDLVAAQEDVARLTTGIRQAKTDYKESLRELNRISDEVHASRSRSQS